MGRLTEAVCGGRGKYNVYLNNNQSSSNRDNTKYERSWADEMITIWKEKITRMNVTRSYSLYNSLSADILINGDHITITHKFLEYGVFQDIGVGYGYKDSHTHSDKGLLFLDPEYRRKHYLDKPKKVGPGWGGYYTSGNPRKARNWMSKKYFASIMVLRDFEADKYAKDYCGMISGILMSDGKKRKV